METLHGWLSAHMLRHIDMKEPAFQVAKSGFVVYKALAFIHSPTQHGFSIRFGVTFSQ